MRVLHLASTVLVTSFVAFGPSGARAQVPSGDVMRHEVNKLDAALNQLFELPTTPATFALGSSTEVVARPGTLRELGAELLSAVDESGNLRPGLAVEIAPIEMLRARADNLEQRDEGDLALMLESLRVSYATTSAVAETPDLQRDPSLLAVGFRIALIDQRDYRRNAAVRAIVGTALETILDDLPICIEDPAALTLLDAAATLQNTDNCATRARLVERWKNGPLLQRALRELRQGWRLELAGAFSRDTASSFGDDKSNLYRQTRFWLATERAYGDLLSLGAALDYMFLSRDITQEDGSQTKIDRHHVRAGARLGFESQPAGFHLQALYHGEDGDQTDWQHNLDLVASLTARLTDAIAVQGSYVYVKHLNEDKADSRLILTFSMGSAIAPIARALGIQAAAQP